MEIEENRKTKLDINMFLKSNYEASAIYVIDS